MVKNTIFFESFFSNGKKFWATVGGMGLTGIIVEATFQSYQLKNSFIECLINSNLDFLMKLWKTDNDYKYSVAWVDSFNKNARGVYNC